ncbi:low molecular weight protein arginine phosphatase [bacterium]|nr:low molecular weight protein arginine phosphatase [bacterium]
MSLMVVVCTGNSCRSPIAEGLLKKEYVGRSGWEIVSAGTSAVPGARPMPEAVSAAAELGADISHHTTRRVNQQLMDQTSLVIAMTAFHAEWLKQHFPEEADKIVTLGDMTQGKCTGDVPDPIGLSDNVYRKIAKLLKRMIDAAREEISERMEGKA